MAGMFKGLRWRLTLLYLLTALAFIVLLNVGTYRLLRNYFQHTTDLALAHKMAHEFRLLGAPVPTELSTSDRDTYATSVTDDLAEIYDSELSSIFVLPLNARGELIFNPNPYTLNIPPDKAAVAAALAQGHDRRTTRLEDGTRMRLLTYRLTRDDGPAVLQLGRTLSDQERILNQLVLILATLGGVSAVGLGAGSWWLAGRSLVPAQQAWERQRAFVANASHELRTPLALIRASVEAALRRLPAEGQRQQRLLRDAVDECDHMSRLIKNLLLLSRLDAGQVPTERVVVQLPELLADIQRQVGQLAVAREVQVQMQAVSGAVWGDPTHLRQVLLILLDNALQYTPAGGSITVSARSRAQEVDIKVSDTGCGIAPEHLPHLFERFYRVDSSRTDGSGGTGLGLSIAKALIEAQQGHIAIASKVAKGTQVTISLPAAPIASSTPEWSKQHPETQGRS